MVKPGLPRLKQPERKKPGPPKRDEADMRSNRLTLRVHDDLMHLLTLRSKEAGLTRSAYIERLMLAWLRADPRNPKFDPMGKVMPTAPTPLSLLRKEPMSVAERWAKYSNAHELLFGQTAPRHLLDDPDSYWPGVNEGPFDDPTDDAAAGTAPAGYGKKKR
jgi:hypothetical protein